MGNDMDRMDLERGSLVAEGDHLMRVVDVSESQKEGPSGYGYWRFDLEIVGKGDPDLSQRMPLILSKSPGARWKIDEFLDAVEAPTSGDVSPFDFVGKVLGTVVEHDKDKRGRLRANIKVMLPVTAGAVKKQAVPDDFAEDIGAKSLPKEAEVSEEGDLDEIPF